jgi:glycerate kinase
MNILIAPDSFKESLTSITAANCIEKGLKEANPKFKIKKVPLADGGEGTVRVLVSAAKGSLIKCRVTAPLGNTTSAYYGILGDRRTAVIEMAQASGLSLVPLSKRNPLKTTTHGTGELIRNALDRGYRKIIIGIGGSATVDGGTGMAQALGVRFLDKHKHNIGFGGGELHKINKIDVSRIHKNVCRTEFIIASDVKNTLLGKKGAAAVYGPQKGANPLMVKKLEKGLKNLAVIIKRDLKIDIANIPGSGAAGGLGAGLAAFCKAKINSGIELIAKISKIEKHIKNADMVITGEGKIDRQTLHGKTIMGVINIARKYHVPVICIAGSVSADAKILYKKGVIGLLDIVPEPMELSLALKNAEYFLHNTARDLGYLLKRIGLPGQAG